MTGFAEDNAPAYEPPMTKAAFLHWVQHQERRYELKDGRTIMQAGTSKYHAWLAGRILTALSIRLDPDIWVVTVSDLAVEIGEVIRYPDVMVERLTTDGAALTTEMPVVLFEILSPSSVATDMTVKLAEYTSLPSLQAYIVASQDEPILWVWQRDAATRAFPAKPQQIDGRDQSLHLAALSIALPLTELYRGIATG
jgi:Uma2 family endonuclease